MGIPLIEFVEWNDVGMQCWEYKCVTAALWWSKMMIFMLLHQRAPQNENITALSIHKTFLTFFLGMKSVVHTDVILRGHRQ